MTILGTILGILADLFNLTLLITLFLLVSNKIDKYKAEVATLRKVMYDLESKLSIYDIEYKREMGNVPHSYWYTFVGKIVERQIFQIKCILGHLGLVYVPEHKDDIPAQVIVKPLEEKEE